ncbi:MAG: hypothetical protein ACK4ZN_08405 [Oceanibaculum sp.]
MIRRLIARRAALPAIALAVAVAAMLPGQDVSAQSRAAQPSSGASSATFDLYLALHEHFVATLPAGWWIGPPQRSGDEVVVRVNIPDSWNGNPTAAMMTACPERRSPIWQATRRITLSPHYRTLSWAPHQCLP